MTKRRLFKMGACLLGIPFVLLAINFFLIYEAGLLVSWEQKSVLGAKNWSFSPTFAFSSQKALLSFEAEDKDVDYVRSSVLVDDARPLTIKNYLEHYHSPLAPYANIIFEKSLKVGLNPFLIVAIGQQESNLCKKAPPECYNCWGIGIHSRGTLCYKSYEEGIEKAIKYLKEEYVDKGLETPEQMMSKYCPLSNGSWAAGVNQFLNELEQGFGK